MELDERPGQGQDAPCPLGFTAGMHGISRVFLFYGSVNGKPLRCVFLQKGYPAHGSSSGNDTRPGRSCSRGRDEVPASLIKDGGAIPS